MTAFVLSGGANRGSVQAGMLEALLDAGIRPDLLVGESIGAANAAFLAADPSPEQARRLSALRRRVQPHQVFPSTRCAWRGRSSTAPGCFHHRAPAAAGA
jgi:NTE family protein